MAGGKNSSKKAFLALRRKKATDLRVAGASYRQIAETIKRDPSFHSPHYDDAQAYRDVANALKEVRDSTTENAQEIRELECQRLDIATMAIANQVRQGNHAAIDRWLRIMERRARLLGLDVDDLNKAWNVIQAHGYERLALPEGGYKLRDTYAENQAKGEAEAISEYTDVADDGD